jgi:hypothetical protein
MEKRIRHGLAQRFLGEAERGAARLVMLYAIEPAVGPQHGSIYDRSFLAS